jgi:hypothetical protein
MGKTIKKRAKDAQRQKDKHQRRVAKVAAAVSATSGKLTSTGGQLTKKVARVDGQQKSHARNARPVTSLSNSSPKVCCPDIGTREDYTCRFHFPQGLSELKLTAALPRPGRTMHAWPAAVDRR